MKGLLIAILVVLVLIFGQLYEINKRSNMKAPDKIYVCVTTPPIALACSEVPWVNKENNFEYIRKEALLEWLNERYKSTISNVGCYTGHSVWAEVIEHLNEM